MGGKPHNALPRRDAPRCGNIHWCYMGKCLVGTLLGMGPQGGVGTRDNAYLRCDDPLHIAQGPTQSYDIPHHIDCGILSGTDHLFWR